MANLIITVIAIALVAVASLMGAYYGGSAFLNNQSAAGASTVLNEGQQLAGAWQAYMSDNYGGVPTDIQQLVTGLTNGSYLATLPSWPAAANGVTAQQMGVVKGTDGHYYALADVGIPVSSGASINDSYAAECLRIIKTATGNTATVVTSWTASAIATGVNGNNTFGCSVYAGGDTKQGTTGTVPTTGHYVMAYKLS